MLVCGGALVDNLFGSMYKTVYMSIKHNTGIGA